jgi:hypothetical protein
MYDDETLMEFRQLARVHGSTRKNPVDIRQLAKVSNVLGENPVDSRQLMKVHQVCWRKSYWRNSGKPSQRRLIDANGPSDQDEGVPIYAKNPSILNGDYLEKVIVSVSCGILYYHIYCKTGLHMEVSKTLEV